MCFECGLGTGLVCLFVLNGACWVFVLFCECIFGLVWDYMLSGLWFKISLSGWYNIVTLNFEVAG